MALIFFSCSASNYQTVPLPAESRKPSNTQPVRSRQQVTSKENQADTAVYQWKADTAWVEETLHSLSLSDKVAQMVVSYTTAPYMSADDDSYNALAHLVRDLHIGGLVISTGNIYEQAVLINKLQKMSNIPLLISSDYEYGVGMRLENGIAFPSNMALGATRDSTLVYQIGKTIAREARAVGVMQNYAPVSDVNDNPENPIINVRSFGEEPQLVGKLASAFIKGTQDAGVVATAKHFPGHGDTDVDSHSALPVINYSYPRLERIELVPFRDDVRAGVKSVMVAHIAFEKFEGKPDIPATLSHKISSDLLQDSLGFHGLIVTDAMTMKGVTRKYSVAEASVLAVKAGADILLMPPDEEVAINAITRAVGRGEISLERIDQSVRKILLTKSELGLVHNRFVNIDSISKVVGVESHRLLAEKAARRSITIVKNDGDLLPLQYHQSQKVLCLTVADNADPKIGAQFREELARRIDYVAYAQIDPRSNEIDFNDVSRLASSVDIVLIPAYIRWRSGLGSVDFPGRIQQFLDTLTNSKKPCVMISFGNPYLLRSVPKVSAYICAYGDMKYSVSAAAEALFGESNVAGRLPITIPNAAQFGDGIAMNRTSLRFAVPEEAGFSADRLAKLDSIVNFWIADSAFPGAELLVARDGKIVYDKAFGTYDYSSYSKQVDPNTMYDLASVTKVTATTLAAMKLYEEGKLDLDAPVVKYIPQFGQAGKEKITIRDLLVHDSGLPPDPPHYLWQTSTIPQDTLQELLKNPRLFLRDLTAAHEAMFDTLFAIPLEYSTGTKMVYSDIGVIVLGKVIEKITGMPLDKYVEENFYAPLGMTYTIFNPPDYLIDDCAPTEYDSASGNLLQGIVHDENARSLGGVAGHAGLFSTASDLAVYLQMLLNGGVYDGRTYLQDSTIVLFTQKQSGLSTRALGWDTKSPKNSSAGHFFSPTSFGHLGFTGTSMWIDPVRQLFVILLTNRVCPTRNNHRIDLVRPIVHDAVIEALVQSQ